jgi:hypothetical protein
LHIAAGIEAPWIEEYTNGSGTASLAQAIGEKTGLETLLLR